MWRKGAAAVSEELVVAQCSPTMAGLKTGSLFACPMEDRAALAASIRRMNAHFVPRGIRMMPVKYMRERVLIYVYRPAALAHDLQQPDAVQMLTEAHYPVGSVDRCVAELMRRLRQGDAFPHEIGLFLGYPAEDVRGFIRLGARRAKCVGAWRVYGDPEAAQRQFARLKKCTRVYCAAYQRHRSLDRLIVTRSSA